MNKKRLAIVLVVSFMLNLLSACENIDAAKQILGQKNAGNQSVSTESPYFYVTNGSVIKERNHYMELEVKIPKIEYSNEDSDPVFDTINKEIESDINKVIEDCKENAYKTYVAYLDTAKTNIKNERDKKINELKVKYKSVLEDNEVKAIAKLLGEEIALDMPEYTATDSELDGFTSTQDLINAGPHNKKIIVKDRDETLKNSSIKETTMHIEGRPGKRNTVVESETNAQSDVNAKKPLANAEVKTATKSEAKVTAKATSSTPKKDTNLPQSQFPPRGNGFGGFGRSFNASFSEAIKKDLEITDEITKENFYKELRNIRNLRTPSDMMLTREYIPMYIYCDFDVKCLDEDYISIYVEIYETRTQMQTKVLFYNIDLKNKKQLGIKDVLGENYKEIAKASINKTIESWDESQKSLLSNNYNIDAFLTDDTTFFINNNHMPVIVFDKYAITAGAAGYPEFQIVK